MSTILFRTHADAVTGIGHLVRCIILARAFSQRGLNCHFLLDHETPQVLPFLSGQNVDYLYEGSTDTLDMTVDAQKTLSFCQRLKPDWVIVDDYRLSQEWEASLHQQGYKVCAFDDLRRPHHCDALVDMGWKGEHTTTGYDGLLPDECLKLLGPTYALLPEKITISPPKQSPQNTFHIMLALGGGGDADLLCTLISSLRAGSSTFSTPLKLLVILGPLLRNAEKVKELYNNTDDVELIQGKTDLSDDILRTDLYIGAAGGILYQLRYLNIPALTFAIAQNQQNDTTALEDLGHYFHINQPDLSVLKGRLAAFCQTVQEHYVDVLQLGLSAQVKVSAQGAHNIVETLISNQHPPSLSLSLSHAHPAPAPILLGEDYRLRKTTHSDINHYRISRNLPANSQNMVITNPIPELEHYCWWFNNKRENYLLFKKAQPALCIWHQKVTYQDKAYLIGGWFVCHEDSNIQDAMVALSWQLDHCDREYPDVPWIAVISKQNKFVKLLNDYNNFLEIDASHPDFTAIHNLFHQADPKSFYYMIRPAQEGKVLTSCQK